jgi:esterase/lipase
MKNLLLLHGAIGAKDQLAPLKKMLNEKFNVYTFNFSGHGKEFFGQKFNIEQFTKDTLSYMLTNKLEEVSVFGYSMGGYVALNLAKNNPEKINQIITLGTKFEWNPTIAAKEVQLLNADLIETKIPAFAKALSNRHGANHWKTLLAKTAAMMVQMGEENPLSLSDYKQIRTPCSLLLAENDEMVSREETKAIQEALPNFSFTSIPNSKHPIEKVDLERLSKEIVNAM